MNSIVRLLSLLSVFLVGSCTYSYEVEAIIANGAVVFRIADGPGFGAPEPEICKFTVVDTAVLNRPSQHSQSSVIEDWDAATVWSFEVPDPEMGQHCSRLPVQYGQVPPRAKEILKARPLVRGRIYRIWARAPGIHGVGSFRVIEAIQNLHD